VTKKLPAGADDVRPDKGVRRRKVKVAVYETEMARLQEQLVMLQYWIQRQGLRVLVIFDGIFSMRGDHAPLPDIADVVARHDGRFRDGVITIMDDSHGIAAYGPTGRGTEEYCSTKVDIFIGTFGKAFGVNGGFVAGSETLVEAVRQKADTYIYTNPLGAADAAAALAAVDVADSAEGRAQRAGLRYRAEP